MNDPTTAAPTLGEAIQQALITDLDEIASVLAHGADETSVHRARKACKRARAVFALLDRPLGRRRRKALDRKLAEIGRPLGPLRDGDVLRRRLVALGRDPARAPDPEREVPRRRALEALAHARPELTVLPLDELGPAAMVRALTESWSQARRTFDAVDPADDESAHTWRKRSKALWIQTVALRDWAPDALDPLITSLDALQETLGDHHDLAVLAEMFGDDPELARDAHLRKDGLLKRARAQGAVVLAARPRALSRWLAQAWVR